MRLLGSDQADLVFTDPPYNVPIDGHVSGNGKMTHREFAMASGEMSEREFQDFLEITLGAAVKASRDGALHYVCMDWRHLFVLLSSGRGIYGSLVNLCVWNKSNGGMGSFYRSQHELVLVFKVGTQAHTNTVELGRHGRNRTNVWDYAGVNAFGQERHAQLTMHPTVKPVALIADAIKDATRRSDLVLDPFCGSGSTIIAAEKTGRRGRGIEIDPQYVDVIVRRWQQYTGKMARLCENNEAFEDVAASRGVDADNDRADYRTRFKKGQSGNPRGRPKGRKNTATLVRDVFYKPVPVKDGSGRRTMPKIALAMEVCLNNACKGDVKSFVKIMEWADKFGLFEVEVESSTPAFRSITVRHVYVRPGGEKGIPPPDDGKEQSTGTGM